MQLAPDPFSLRVEGGVWVRDYTVTYYASLYSSLVHRLRYAPSPHAGMGLDVMTEPPIMYICEAHIHCTYMCIHCIYKSLVHCIYSNK